MSKKQHYDNYIVSGYEDPKVDPLDRYSRRYGEITPTGSKFHVQPAYQDAVDFCIQLFRSGKHLSDAIYITRLTFTDPSTPHYMPLERWNSKTFLSMVLRRIKTI